jgi:hypothetical protein
MNELEKQDMLRRALDSYINNKSLTNLSKIFYPLINRHKNYFNSGKKSLSEDEYLKKLVELAKEFYSTKKKLVGKKKTIETLDPKSWDKGTKYHKLIKEISNKLTSDNFELLVHGSFATNDYVPNWSDLDTILIIKNISIESIKEAKRKLKKAMPLFFKIDPLQHHGPFCIFKEEFNNYCQNRFLPIEVFTKCVNPKKKIKLDIYIIEDWEYTLNTLKKKNLKANLKYPINRYQWKELISRILLFPLTVLQANKILCDKKNSFTLSKKYLKKEEIEIINICEDIRKKWKYKPSILDRITNKLNLPLTNMIRQKIILEKKPSELRAIDKNKLKMIEKMYKRITTIKNETS